MKKRLKSMSQTKPSSSASSANFVPCQTSCNNEALFYCEDCGKNQNWCEKCYYAVHEHQKDHSPPYDAKERATFTHRLTSLLLSDDSKATNEDLESSLFLYYDPEMNRLIQGPLFEHLRETSKRLPQLVSFVGATGDGKSMLIRCLADAKHGLPSSSPPKSIVSHTADVQGYHMNGVENWMLLDTEGVGGNMQPVRMLKSMLNITDTSKRRKIVELAYPRLLYAFSRIICYVCRNPKAVGEIVSKLKDYGSQGASGIINMNASPQLIIIFNKVEYELAKENTAKTWFNQNKEAECLLELFSNVSVFFLPQVSEKSPMEEQDYFFSKISRIHRKIMEYSQESFKPRARFDLFDAALRALSKDPSAALDFDSLSSRQGRQREREEEGQEYPQVLMIVQFFDSVVQHFMHSQSNISYFEAWYKAIPHLVTYCLRAYIIAYERNNSSLPTKRTKMLVNISRSVMVLINKSRPCSAIHNFRYASDGKVGAVRCDNKEGRHNTHGSRKYWIESRTKWLIFSDQVRMPCRWRGDYEPVPEQDFIADVRSKFDMWLNSESLQLYFPVEAALLEQMPLPLKSCTGCFMSSPNCTRTCGHNFCKICVHSEKCLICAENSQYLCVPPSAGARVLCLDGGGVRGVVSLQLLLELERFTYGIPVTSLFDLIVGTSTGGILALALAVGKKSVQECLQLYTNLAGNVFQPKWYRKGFFRMLTQAFHQLYSSEQLTRELKTIFGTSRLASAKPRIAVTTTFSNKHKLAIISSYARTENGQISEDGTFQFTAVQAALATSAAPTYFPPFQAPNGELYSDGGLVANNPCVAAYKEANELFPDNATDLLLSIGTGLLPASSQPISNRFTGFIRNTIENSLDADRIWDQFEHRNKQGFSRLNPPLSKQYELDCAQEIPQMIRETQQFVKSQKIKLQTISRKLIAKLFYAQVDRGSEGSKEVRVTIFARIRRARRLLQDSSDFSFAGLNYKSIGNPAQNSFEYTVVLPSGQDMIHVNCHIPCVDSDDQSPIPISGSPYQRPK